VAGSGTSFSGGGQQDTGPPLGVIGGEVTTPMAAGASVALDSLSPAVIGIAPNPGSRPT
jgi:hypothetical protein